MSIESFEQHTGVSRETRDKFQTYHDLLIKWQQTINLVGNSTLEDAWDRHFQDSAQLFTLLPKNTKTLVDMGSGAGFPGLVLALMGVEDVHLIESDSRKCAFLDAVVRACDLNVTIHNCRIGVLPEVINADVVTARALSRLKLLLGHASKFVAARGGVCIFPKGETVADEITEARKSWKFYLTEHPSQTHDQAKILYIEGLAPKK